VNIVDSVWIINFEDGDRLCMTEDAYREFKTQSNKHGLTVNIISEEHWFDKKKAKEKYDWIY
jgi:hypothetical protein